MIHQLHPSIPSCLRKVLPGLELQWERSYSPGKYFSPDKLYFSTKLNSSLSFNLIIQVVDGVYYVSDCSFRSRIGVPLICKKIILTKCILNDAHADLGHGRDVLQMLRHIQSKFFIPRVRKIITNLKKSCSGCIKLNKVPFVAYEADVPDVLKSIQPPFTYCQANIFGPVFAHVNSNKTKRWVLVVLCLSSRRVHLNLCSAGHNSHHLDQCWSKHC